MSQNKPKKDSLYHQIIEALDYDSCSVCFLLRGYTERLIENILYELINDGSFQSEVMHSKGFCQKHTDQMRAQGDALGHSIIYQLLLKDQNSKIEKWLDESENESGFDWLNRFHDSKSSPRKLLETIESEYPCPICEKVENMETHIIAGISSYFNEYDEFHKSYKEKGVLCFPHFSKLLYSPNPTSEIQEIVLIQKERFELLEGYLAEIIRKSDYRFSQEPVGKERGSWLKVSKLWSGDY